MFRALLFITFSYNLLAAVVTDVECDSCLIEVNSLDEPVNLSGNWLFTKNDDISNKQINTDLSDWRLVYTPGRWGKVYEGNKNFRVGWYKGKVKFAPHLIGKKVTFVVDTYISELDIYVDEKLLFTRSENSNNSASHNFLPIQNVRVDFPVTKAVHDITFRIDTILMKGVYQYPFQLRDADVSPWFLDFLRLFSYDTRVAASILFLSFGLFFLFLYLQLKDRLYLYCFMGGITAFPFFGLPNESMIHLMGWENVVILHYIGLALVPFAFYFIALSLNKKDAKVSKAALSIILPLNVVFIFLSNESYFNHSLFLFSRKTVFLIGLIVAVLGIYHSYKALSQGRGRKSLFFGMLAFLLTSIHDTFLALDIISSVITIHLGLIIMVVFLVYYVSLTFSEAETQKNRYLKELVELNNTLEAKVDERTEALKEAKNRVATLAHSAGMAEIATGVIHDIGNIVTTVSILREKIQRTVERSKFKTLQRFILHTFEQNKQVAEKAFGADVVRAYKLLGVEVQNENNRIVESSLQMGKSIESIKNILISQQEYAKVGGFEEKVDIGELISDIISMELVVIQNGNIQILINFHEPLVLYTHKNKIFHIFINVIKNAIEALAESDQEDKQITIFQDSDVRNIIHIKDNGVGIAQADLNRIFTHGHTTKKYGHGFGLHASFNTMKEVGGDLQVFSEGLGKGATFSIRLPSGESSASKKVS